LLLELHGRELTIFFLFSLLLAVVAEEEEIELVVVVVVVLLAFTVVAAPPEELLELVFAAATKSWDPALSRRDFERFLAAGLAADLPAKSARLFSV
jgi:hypothetical protein